MMNFEEYFRFIGAEGIREREKQFAEQREAGRIRRLPGCCAARVVLCLVSASALILDPAITAGEITLPL
jgi:hypothetical protein